MPDRDLRRDEDLQAALGDALDAVEPVPHASADAAIELAFTLRSIEEQLALVADTLVDTTDGFRNDESDTRHLRFESGAITIELDIDLTNDELVGQVLPPSSVPVEIESLRSSMPVTVDDAGRFVARVPSRQFRLRVAIDGRGHVTAWVFR